LICSRPVFFAHEALNEALSEKVSRRDEPCRIMGFVCVDRADAHQETDEVEIV
jgi:hypothetical protein